MGKAGRRTEPRPAPAAANPLTRAGARGISRADFRESHAWMREGIALAKPEWGTKRICHSCSTRFYDLLRDPIVCPSCGTEFDPEALLRTRRSRSVVSEREPVAAAPEAPEAEAPEEEIEVEADPDPVEEVEDEEEAEEGVIEEEAAEEEEGEEEEEDLIEDASELGEDEDDMAEVIDQVDPEDDR
jgi:uncharacterized protein (TIGR02300 family)